MIRIITNALRRQRLTKAGISVEIECRKAVYGHAGGSWIICPDTINSTSVIYSFGIGRDISFDLDLIRAHNIAVHAFDPTPASIQWVRHQATPPSLKFHEYGIAHMNGEIEFHAPRKTTSAHYTPVKRYRKSEGQTVMAPVKTLNTIMAELGHNRIDLLKMDIEGGEYAVIDTIVKTALPIQQILVEFHHAYETIPLSATVASIHGLRSLGFKVFAISERGYEISMIKVVQKIAPDKVCVLRR